MLGNLYLVFAFWKSEIYPAALHTATTVRLIALLNLVIFGGVMASDIAGAMNGITPVRQMTRTPAPEPAEA